MCGLLLAWLFFLYPLLLIEKETLDTEKEREREKTTMLRKDGDGSLCKSAKQIDTLAIAPRCCQDGPRCNNIIGYTSRPKKRIKDVDETKKRARM